uniref:Chymotrypsin inhibitor n=1 Tax=Lumbricus terrestris TaxID=6398 RepID=ICI_LUMTE|nr:RecName: Full=Chymotrypsin inhibitor; Short=LTCI; Flags: Precursor [Lumbricus terrestris]AAV35366.1 chymotrypsin inhibitor precursor [Lumbricus terrestris]
MKLLFAIVALLALAFLCADISAVKTSWPELVGETLEEAKAQILEDRPDAVIKVQPEHSPVTYDYRPSRVIIFVNKDGNVAETPAAG